MTSLLAAALLLAAPAEATLFPNEGWLVTAEQPIAVRGPAGGPRAADRWLAWFQSEPGGPLDAPGYRAPAPATGDWREFETPRGLAAWSKGRLSDALPGHDGIERIAYRHGGSVYFALRTGTQRGAGWRHERVAETSLEWGGVALVVDYRGRAHVAFETAHESGRRWAHAVREPYGLWSQERLPAVGKSSGRCGALVLDGDSVAHLVVEADGRVKRLLNDLKGERGWREDSPPSGELGAEECPAAAVNHSGTLTVAWASPGGELRVSTPAPGWFTSVITRSAGSPRFVASREGRLAISFIDAHTGGLRRARWGRFPRPYRYAAPVPPAAPRSRAPEGALGLLLAASLARVLLVLRRARQRRGLRSHAALVGRGLLVDVVVRHRGAGLRPASAGVLLLHARASVLWTYGLSPSEAWLGPAWTARPGRPGWVELRCGPVELEVAPEPGLRFRAPSQEARRLHDVLTASRALQRELVSQSPE